MACLVAAGWAHARAERAARAREGMTPLAVPPFSLTERSGREVSRETLLGRPWIAGFVFTRCGGPCPALSEKMAALQADLARTDARLVSVSVDPAHDTPQVLSTYASLYKADPERWLFLTGTPAAVDSLAIDGFKLGVARLSDGSVPPGQSVTHDTHLALVDREGKLRGYYDSDDPAKLEALRRDARLLGTPPGTGRGSSLPPVNALLNGTSAVLLLLGFFFVRARRIEAHQSCMLLALAVSAAFLACYVVYHAKHGSTPFVGEGFFRSAYYAILISHVLLAVLVVPLVLRTLYLAILGDFVRHVPIARWTFAIWLYVSVTGVAVYLLLYRIFVPA